MLLGEDGSIALKQRSAMPHYLATHQRPEGQKEKYTLLTSKRHNFNLFIVLSEIILKKEHLTVSGFLKSI